MSLSGRGQSNSRVAQFRVRGPFSEKHAESLLERAKTAGVVTAYDTGRGDMVWFEGPPGQALRALRVQIAALVLPKKVKHK